MGDAAVNALVKDVLGRLTSEVIKEFDLLWGLKKDVLALKDEFEEIQAVLQDAQEKQINQKEVALWLDSVRSASVKVENVLDDISTEVLLRRVDKKRGLKYRVRAFFSSDHNLLMFHVRIAHKVKTIRGKLDAIKSRRSELGLTPKVISELDVGVEDKMPDRETSSLIHDSSTILGRNKEIEMIIEKICDINGIGKYENGEVLVYGIWGMGGSGKTTLAQLVYNHQRVNQYFDLKCWVYVSENFQVKEILKGIITSIDKCGCTITQLYTLQNILQSKLMGKKFLIVLDDVWIEEDEKAKWDELSKTLSCGIEGSIVLMTTRSQRTSQIFAKVPELQHNLGCLSPKDSWLLFQKFAFAEGREGDDISTLEPIGRQIVEKCEGLPLAVKTLGSLMWSKKSTRDWEHVKDNMVWNLKESKVLPALKLSYDNLLPHVKRCFSYCCLFPKGYELEKNVLVPLWLSNGFIPPREETSPYYLGEEIFNCLVWRSFFQFFEEKYIMHDLMHDMARHVMGDGCLVIEPAKEAIVPNEVRHLSSSFLLSPQDYRKLTSLRSLFILEIYIDDISQIFNHIYIRVLHTNSRLKTLPESICKLKHLRYLNLSDSLIEVLPESIIYLQNLQVLILDFCRNLCKLPEGLRYMRNLQHLNIEYCKKLLHLPPGIKKLTSLRILSKFPVGNKSGAKIGELGDLNLLEGELVLQGLENVGGLNEAESANLKCKTNLLVLVLLWSKDRECWQPEIMAHDEEVLCGLEPNSCLNKLRLQNYMGDTISPSWMIKLSNLVEITFWNCTSCCLPALGRLPKLRSIKIWQMLFLKCFHDEDTTNVFPSLQKLDIGCCSSLVSLPCNLPKLEVLSISCGLKLVSLPGNLPKLEFLDISDCLELVSLPCNLPKLEVLNISACRELVSLPCNLPNIRELHLRGCDGLLSLPDEIQSFKDLNKLTISCCKHLFKKYGENVGEDWPKVSHIPSISIKEFI